MKLGEGGGFEKGGGLFCNRLFSRFGWGTAMGRLKRRIESTGFKIFLIFNPPFFIFLLICCPCLSYPILVSSCTFGPSFPFLFISLVLLLLCWELIMKI